MNFKFMFECGDDRAVPLPKMKILIGKLSYDPKKLIGRGAFSNVYHGLFEGKTRVAVKRIPKSETENNHGIMNEVNMFKDLDHSNIVKYIGMEMNDDFW